MRTEAASGDEPTPEELAPTTDRRSPAEHDCDRILYSDELRRLGGVTQVVAVGERPLFHTRLTHTLKVQQLARRMAEHLSRDEANAHVIAALGGLDVSAAEAAGLAHDLGHPPFGHVGEEALNRCLVADGLDGFEGNAQTFRILTKLSRRGEEPRYGLGLTDMTLAAVIKYPTLRIRPEQSKWNAYPTEATIFQRVRAKLDSDAVSAEAAIMDWADDITYAIHDLEDFIRAGRVPMAHLATANGEPERAAFIDRAVSRLRRKVSLAGTDWEVVGQNFSDTLWSEFAQLAIHTGSAEQLAQLRSACSRLIGQYVSAISLEASAQPLRVPLEIRAEVELFKQLTWHYVIHDPALATLQQGQVEIVEALYSRLRTWLEEAEGHDEMFRLPRRLVAFYAVTEDEPGQEAYGGSTVKRRARATADYIASLTEGQALDLHERLFGSGGHSVLDPWLAY